MRILGVDYGQKRIGLAIGDENETLAFPFDLIQKTAPLKVGKLGKFKVTVSRWNKAELEAIAKEIGGICQAEQVKLIVVGLPLNLSGKETAITQEVKDFVSVLKKIVRLPVVFEKEFLTSKLAEKKMKEAGIKNIKEKLDAASAAEILQSYLDRKKLTAKN